MRLDDAGPRTWLLGALAAWALAAWLLALAGMGGRIAPLPDDPSAAQALPAPAPPAPGRLGPASDYQAIAARPLLSPTRRPQPFSLVAEAEGEAVQERFDFVLTGVLMTPNLQMATLQPTGGGESIRLRVGEAPDAAPSWRLASVAPRAAVFDGPDGTRTLELRSYDGGADLRASATPRPRPRRDPPDAGAVPAAADDMAEGPVPDMEAGSMEDADTPTPESQMEAIRKRIEARRAQLRREARQPTTAEPPPLQER